jgi:hypothetical protein
MPALTRPLDASAPHAASPRERFFAVLEGRNCADVPFIPDITDWYVANRTPPGQARPYGPGEFIPDDDPLHLCHGTIPAAYRDFTLLEFYRRFGWGFHAHIYSWCRKSFTDGVTRTTETRGRTQVTVWHTPKGSLQKTEQMAADGTWCPREHYVKSPEDLDILRCGVAGMRFTPDYGRIARILDALGNAGQVDAYISRSPFGKLVQEYMGFENVAYALADCPRKILDFLAFQEERDLEVVELAARGPQRLVLLSDHADENLIAPSWYRDYAMPFYRRATDILHAHGKLVSTHLDGNIRGLLPLLAHTGFDLLDGCTPAPMFNYEVEELAAALPPRMFAFCGVPATLFCRRRPTEELLAFGDRIRRAFRGRGFLNVGDILPPDGDIEQVIALGRDC